ncbi:hypothetical protein DRJ17_06605 [Candidatus Woesearchaeota archaeon]|nr:MAG: hypothetical protein DRJ17_06605 [Candidatus Woesearchaeota archaeon]
MDIEPKWIVYGALIIPTLYIVMEWEFSVFILVGLVMAGFYFFSNNFINKDNSRFNGNNIPGPQSPLVSEQQRWDYKYDAETGQPVPRRTYVPPKSRRWDR